MRHKVELQNLPVFHHYEILDKFEAGIELLGHEVKSLYAGRGSLRNSYVSAADDQLFLLKLYIPVYQKGNVPKDYDEQRPRRLLLHKKQIRHLIGKLKEKGLTIVPIRVYNKGSLIKVEIALARGLKKYEKREKVKKREFEREKARVIKQG
jgi:SsrA-binding protein